MHLERFKIKNFLTQEKGTPLPLDPIPPQMRPKGKKYKKGGCGENNKMGEQG